MENNTTFFERINLWMKNSVAIRLVTIGVLILLLLIPIEMVKDVIRERKHRKRDAIKEVSSKWGDPQIITGVVLTVPYKAYTKIYEDKKNNIYRLVESTNYAHFLPEDLNIKGKVLPEMRYRGIYEVVVYSSNIDLFGTFVPPDFSDWKIASKDILWEDAFISLGLEDLRGVQENVVIKWDKKEYAFNPGVESKDVITNGISTRIPLSPTKSKHTLYEFSLNLNFNGSYSLNFIPLGKVTKVDIHSSWKSPKFNGAFLPDKRDINDSGFSATWQVLHLNRAYPQKFKESFSGINKSAFGVDFFVPIDEYQKSMRSAKYATIFIALTFLIFFFVQVLNRIKIHPIQYIIVGLALCVFYTLLIALSEHMCFQLSYFISSISIISIIVLYAKSMFKNTKLTLLLALILCLLYVFVFSVIQIEDYALLMGSIGLFIILSIVMYLSRKIDWYAINEPKNIKKL